MGRPEPRVLCNECRKRYSRSYIKRHTCKVFANVDYVLDITIQNKIRVERMRQIDKHPDFPKRKRMAILAEEVGEVAEAFLEDRLDELEDELVQVASVAIRWLDHINRERRKKAYGKNTRI